MRLETFANKARAGSRLDIALLAGGLFCIGASLVWLYSLVQGVGPQLTIKATAHQWWWEFDYPTLGVRTSDSLYLPSDRRVRIELTSADVIHSFWILGMKKSITIPPNGRRAVDLITKSTGKVYGNCDSGCGCGTTCMRFRVLIETPMRFTGWGRNSSEGDPQNSNPSWFRRRRPAQATRLATIILNAGCLKHSCSDCWTEADAMSESIDTV